MLLIIATALAAFAEPQVAPGNELFVAARRADAAAVRALLEADADPDQEIASSWAPLHRAAGFGSDEVVDLLLGFGADPNRATRHGLRALHFAAAAGATERVRSLVAAGAAIDARCASGKTALDYADAHEQRETATLLREFGARPGPVEFPDVRGEYLGMRPPGMAPEPFAPELLNQPFSPHGPLIFTPDGGELFFSFNAMPIQSRWHMQRDDEGRWSAPAPSFLAPETYDNGLCFSVDGERAYFHSSRGASAGTTRADADLWTARRTPVGWSELERLSAVLNTDQYDYYPSVAASGAIYFSRQHVDGRVPMSDLYRAPFGDGEYGRPLRLGAAINSDQHDVSVCVAPDESFLLYSTSRVADDGGLEMHLNVSFRSKRGEWSQAVNISPVLAVGEILWTSLSPDSRYLFLNAYPRGGLGSGYGAFYWVDARVIEQFRPE